MTPDNQPDNLDPQPQVPTDRPVTPSDPATPARSTPFSKTSAPAKAAPRRRRRWPYIVGGILLLLIVLVLLIPTIVSSGAGRSFIVGKINDNLNGRVEIADWSISWTGGIRVNGVRVFDDRNSQVAQIELISTQLSLLDAARGNLAIGDTVIRGADFTLVQGPDGSFNLARLAKPSNKPDEPAGDLPNLSGTIRIENSRGTFVRNTGDPATSQKVKMSDIAGTIAIPNINDAIDHQLAVTASVNDGPAGTLSVKGKADVVADRRVNLAGASFDERIDLKQLSGAAVSAFLPPSVVRELGGTLDGSFVAQSSDGKTITIRSQIDGKQVVLATAAFATGEAYRTDALALMLPITITLPNGLSDVAAGMVRTDGPVSLKTDDVTLSLAADAPLATLQSAAANEAPKQPGKINQTLSVDVASLAAMLPKTLGVRPDAKLESGWLKQSITGDLSPGRSQLSVALNVSELKGSTAVANAEGRTVRQSFAVEPIDVTLTSVSQGGGWKAPDLHDLKLTLQSGFANGEFTAPTLASLNGQITADLAKLKSQLGQFTQLQDVPLSGNVVVAADSTGDPTRPSDPATFKVTVTGTDVNTVVAGKTLKQPLVVATLAGTLQRTETGDVKQASDIAVSLRTGEKAAPTVDVQLEVSTVQYVPPAGNQPARYDVPKLTIAKANIALKRAQDEFGQFIPALREFDLAGGVASVSGTASHLNGATRLDLTVATNNLDFARYFSLAATGPASSVRQRTQILTDYTLTAKIDATYAPLQAGGSKLTVATLDVGDNQNLISLNKTGDLVVTMPEQGAATASGKLALGLDLAQAHELVRRFSATTQEVIAEASSGQKPVLVRKGRLTGTVDLSQQPDGGLTVALDGGVDALTLAGDQPVLTDEKVSLKLKATTGPQVATAALDQLQLTSGIASVDAKGQFVLKTGAGENAEPVPPLQMVRQFHATITSQDVAKLQAVMDALAATKKPVALGPPTPRALAVQLAAADGKLPAGTPVPDSPQPTMLEQIAELRVTALQASGVGAAINLKQPLVATSPSELMDLFSAPAANAAPKTPATAPAAQPPATQPAPVPPTKLAGGSATITLDVTGDGRNLTITPDVAMQKLVLAVGEGRREVGDVTLKSAIAVASRPAGANPPADAKPTLAGAFTVTGQIAPLMELQAFMGGEKPVSGYAGALNLEQTIGTEGTTIKLAGGGTVADFVVRDAAGKPGFTEPSLKIANDVSLDTASSTLALGRLAVIFEGSGALNLEANGKINDFGRSLTIEYVLANVSYDAAKVWQILKPMLSDPQTPADTDPYKDYIVEGKATRQFALAGSLPAVDEAGNPVPMRQALRSLGARGSIALDKVQAEGLTIEGIELPVALSGGIVKVIDVAKPAGEQLPAPYKCNGGTINIGGVEVNLNGDVALLSTPPNLAILNKVQLNPALSAFLGGLVNNPLFVPSADTKGIVDVTIQECRGVPLGKQFKVHGGANKGYAVATFDFSGAQFKNDFIIGLTNGLTKFTPLKLDPDSWQGSIRNGKVTYSDGYVGHDMTLVLGEQQERSIRLYGNTRLDDKTMVPLTMLFSSEWFGGEFARYVPKGLPVALTGPFTAPRYDVGQAVQATIRQNYLSGKPEDIGRIIDLFSRGKKKDDEKAPANDAGGGAASRPAAKPQDNPIGILGDILGQAAREREKKEQEKREKEQREKERRKKQQQE